MGNLDAAYDGHFPWDYGDFVNFAYFASNFLSEAKKVAWEICNSRGHFLRDYSATNARNKKISSSAF